jgi:hypothetical protein
MPAAVFTVLLGALVVPLLPWARTFLVGLDPSGGDGILVGLGFVTVILAGVLLVVSDLPVRLYEGYYWRHGLLGRLLTSRYRGEFERMTAAVDGIEVLRQKMDKEAQKAEWAALGLAITPLKRELRNHYPDRADLVLPTRLGNTIRCFERYPSQEYRIDGVRLWDHLSVVMDASLLTRVEQARANLNFLLNLSFLLGVLVASLVTLAVWTPRATLLNAWLPAAILALLSVLAHRGSLWLALLWGDLVRASFDLYRDRLYEELGYGELPKNRAAERKEWAAITGQILFGDRHGQPRVGEDPVVGKEEAKAEIEVVRGIRPTWIPGQLEIVVRARNRRKEALPGPVTVEVPVPEGYEYVWGSAKTPDADVTVSGEGPPYTFELDCPLEGEAEAGLTFRVLSVKPFPTP